MSTIITKKQFPNYRKYTMDLAGRPLTLETGKLAEGIEGQAHQSLKNLGSILKEAGMDYADVVKTTCYLKTMEDFSLFNEIYAQYFGEHTPARSCFAVAQLPKGALVEIEAVAVKG